MSCANVEHLKPYQFKKGHKPFLDGNRRGGIRSGITRKRKAAERKVNALNEELAHHAINYLTDKRKKFVYEYVRLLGLGILRGKFGRCGSQAANNAGYSKPYYREAYRLLKNPIVFRAIQEELGIEQSELIHVDFSMYQLRHKYKICPEGFKIVSVGRKY